MADQSTQILLRVAADAATLKDLARQFIEIQQAIQLATVASTALNASVSSVTELRAIRQTVQAMAELSQAYQKRASESESARAAALQERNNIAASIADARIRTEQARTSAIEARVASERAVTDQRLRVSAAREAHSAMMAMIREEIALQALANSQQTAAQRAASSAARLANEQALADLRQRTAAQTLASNAALNAQRLQAAQDLVAVRTATALARTQMTNAAALLAATNANNTAIAQQGVIAARTAAITAQAQARVNAINARAAAAGGGGAGGGGAGGGGAAAAAAGGAGGGFLGNFTMGAAIGAGFIAIQQAAVLARDAVVEFFKTTVVEGVKFNATLEQASLGIASVLRTFNPETYRSFDEAITRSTGLIEQLKKKALETPATFQSLLQAFQGAAGSMSAAGIPLKKQVDLMTNVSQGMVALGIRTEEMRQEASALLDGRIDRNARLANTLGITSEHIRLAKEQGDLYGFLTLKLKEFNEAGMRGALTISTLESNLLDARMQAAANGTKLLTESYRELLIELTVFVKSENAADMLKWLESLSSLAVIALINLTKVFQGQSGMRDSYSVGKRGNEVLGVKKLAEDVTSIEDVNIAKQKAEKTANFIDREREIIKKQNAIDRPAQDLLQGTYEERAARISRLSENKESLKRLDKLAAETKNIIDALNSPEISEVIAKNIADNLADAASAQLIQSRKRAAVTTDKNKETAPHDEREQMILAAADGNRNEQIAALDQAMASVRKEFAEKKAKGANLLRPDDLNSSDLEVRRVATEDEASRKSETDALDREERDQIKAFQQKKIGLEKQERAEAAAFMKQQASHGNLMVQITAKTAAIDVINKDQTLTPEQRARQTATIQTEIGELQQRQYSETLAFMKQQSEHGTVNEKVAVREAEILLIKQNTSLGVTQIARQELELRRQIAELRMKDAEAIGLLVEKEEVRLRVLASEIAQRKEAARITGIKQDPLLTDRQKKAELFTIYSAQAASLPAQIRTSEDLEKTFTADGKGSGKIGSAGHQAAVDETKRLKDRAETVGNDIKTVAPKSAFLEIREEMTRIESGFQTIAQSVGGVMQSMFSGISSSIEGLINRTMTWRNAFLNVGSAITGSLVKGLADHLAQFIMTHVIMNNVRAAFLAMGISQQALAGTAFATAKTVETSIAVGAETAKTTAALSGSAVRTTAIVAEAGTTASATGIAAVFTSIMQLGPIAGPLVFGIAIAGMIALISTLTKGFAAGGFTGTGGVLEPAGVVHKGEVVFSQKDVSRAGGVAAVENMRVSGGTASRASAMTAGGSAGSGGPAIGQGGGSSVNMAYFNTKQDAATWLASQGGRRVMVDFIRQSQTEM